MEGCLKCTSKIVAKGRVFLKNIVRWITRVNKKPKLLSTSMPKRLRSINSLVSIRRIKFKALFKAHRNSKRLLEGAKT